MNWSLHSYYLPILIFLYVSVKTDLNICFTRILIEVYSSQTVNDQEELELVAVTEPVATMFQRFVRPVTYIFAGEPAFCACPPYHARVLLA
jgi:hypothetical protein